MMKQRIWSITAAVLLFCTGCMGRTPKPQNKTVVSQICVTCQQEGTAGRRTYTDGAKMKQILNALRQVGQQFDPEVDPEPLELRTYCITLTHSDGSRRSWYTKGDRYIRREDGPWQQADPKKISQLNQLLQILPGDTPEALPHRSVPLPR